MKYRTDDFSDFADFDAKPLSDSDFLALPQVALPAPRAEALAEAWAATGFLLLALAPDAAPHGDALFRQTRPSGPPPAPADFWAANHRLHLRLCEAALAHLPLRLAPAPAAPAALAWLLPAPVLGTLQAPGFSRPQPLDAACRAEWLTAWAARLGTALPPGLRLLLQLPAAEAFWHYHAYRGEAAVPGPPLARIRTLLAGLPRYHGAAAPLPAPLDTAHDWPLLVNEAPEWDTGQRAQRAEHWEVPIAG